MIYKRILEATSLYETGELLEHFETVCYSVDGSCHLIGTIRKNPSLHTMCKEKGYDASIRKFGATYHKKAFYHPGTKKKIVIDLH